MELAMFCKDRLEEVEDPLLGLPICEFLAFLGKAVALRVSRLLDTLWSREYLGWLAVATAMEAVAHEWYDPELLF